MEWFGIAALLLLLWKIKQLEKKQRGAMYMSTLINSLVGKQCIIRSDSFLGFAGKTEVSCKIVDADDEWIRICYTEKKTNK